MSREFGIYPTDREPQLWIGCRAIITERRLDIPWDRWSNDIKYISGKDDFVWWINNVALKEVENRIKNWEHKFTFESGNGLFYCEADDRNGCGYMYIGFGSTEKYDEMIREDK
jgi:hypothetical protein